MRNIKGTIRGRDTALVHNRGAGLRRFENAPNGDFIGDVCAHCDVVSVVDTSVFLLIDKVGDLIILIILEVHSLPAISRGGDGRAAGAGAGPSLTFRHSMVPMVPCVCLGWMHGEERTAGGQQKKVCSLRVETGL